MAKPAQPPAPVAERILVNGLSPFHLLTPPLFDAQHAPLIGRTCDVEIAAPDGALIHPTLRVYARCLGTGSYHATFTPRALWLHLTTDRQPVDLVMRVRGFDPVRIPAIVERVAALTGDG